MRPLCQFFTTPDKAERDALGLPEGVVVGCEDEQGDGPLFFFVPVNGGAVRAGVCPRHARLLAEHHGQPAAEGDAKALAAREESLRAAGYRRER